VAAKYAVTEQGGNRVEELGRPFGRMVLTGYPPGEVFLLDLFLTPDFVGRGFFVGWHADPRQAPLHIVETVLNRAAWEALEGQTAVFEEDLPVHGRLFGLTDYADLDTLKRGVASEIYLILTRPDPAQTAWRGRIDLPYFRDPDEFGRFNFPLEEFGSPDPLTVALAMALLLFGGATLADWLQDRYSNRAAEMCKKGNVASIKISTKLGALGAKIETSYEIKCKEEDESVGGKDQESR
jgi:hypothetical protein